MAELQPERFQRLWQLPFEGSWPMAVAFVGTRYVASGNRDGTIVVWPLPDGQAAPDAPPSAIRWLQGHDNGITRLLGTPDGRHLISASLDHTVRIWDLDAPAADTAQLVLDAETRQRRARSSGKKDAPDEPGVTVQVQREARVLSGHRAWVQALGLSRDGRRLISGDDACLTIVWDVTSGSPLARWTGYPDNAVVSAALSPDGAVAFTGEYCHPRGDYDRPPAQARLWNAAEGRELLDLLVVQFPNVRVRDNSYGYASTWGKFVGRGFVAADFSPDGTLLAVGQGGETDTGRVHLIEVASGKLLRTVSGHQYGVTDVRFSADGRYVLSAGRDTTLRICQTDDGKEVARLGEPRGGQFKDWLSALDLSADQQYLAAADIAGIVHVWRQQPS
jgi:WD40 repeat protein